MQVYHKSSNALSALPRKLGSEGFFKSHEISPLLTYLTEAPITKAYIQKKGL